MPTLRVNDLKVRSLDVALKEITWTIDSGQEDVLDYRFAVLRSESPGGPFEAISPWFQDRYIFVDARIPQGDKFRQLFYRLRVVQKATDTAMDSAVVTQGPEPDLVAQQIRRMEMTLFTQGIGRQVWLFKRRTFGARCRACWDSTLHKKTREKCLSCFDTGFLRGFHNPIEVWMQIDPATKAQQNNPQQISQVVITSARMSYYPETVPGDVVVEAENKRWTIQKVTPSERLRATVKQELVLAHIDTTDIEYKLPINLDHALRDIQPSPVRMYENATDLNSAIANRTPNIFAAYDTLPRDPDE